jgi:hypothetical protein
MAAVSRRLPRGLAHVRCARFISASNLERCGSNFMRTSEDKNSGASSDSRRKSKRDDGLELNRIYDSSAINPQDRCGNDFGMRHYRARASHFIEPSGYSFRSVMTAVSDEEKQRPEVDDEDLDLKTDENKIEEVNNQSKQNDDNAKTSMYASPQARLTNADVNKFLKLR